MRTIFLLPRTTDEEIRVFFASYAREGMMEERATLSREARLARFRHFLAKLGNPQEAYKTIHIAGTTGKGSTCTYIEAILRAHGFRTGLSVSPHVSDVRERFEVDKSFVSTSVLRRALEEVIRVASALEEEGTRIGYMDFVRALSYWLFAEQRVAYAVIETGVGGLWDGSNVVERPDKYCVLTKLGRDHLDVLGPTIESIAMHKTGIIQPGNEVVIGMQEEISEETLVLLAQQRGAQNVWRIQPEETEDEGSDACAPYLQENALLAREACRHLADRDGWLYEDDRARDAMKRVQIPLRFEAVSWKGKTVILDAAHNPQKMRGLVRALEARFPDEPCAIAFACNPGTDVEETILPLLRTSARLACVDVLGGEGVYQFRFMDPSDILEQLSLKRELESSLEIIREWDALLSWIEHAPERVIVLTGSFHFAASARGRLLNSLVLCPN